MICDSSLYAYSKSVIKDIIALANILELRI